MNDSVEKLLKGLEGRDLIVFAGSGLSSVTGVNKWRELLESLNQEVHLEGVDISKVIVLHFPEIAQMIYNSLEREGRINRYYAVIKECMQPTRCSWHSGHQKIIRACSSIITTNIDSIFEKALTDELEEPPRGVPVGQKCTYQTLSNLVGEDIIKPYHITYLHGRHDEQEIILKTSDYVKHYKAINGEEETNLEKILGKIFCRREAIIFVGFSFGDRFVLSTFERKFRELRKQDTDITIEYNDEGIKPDEIKHYALLEDPLKEDMEREKWLIENCNNLHDDKDKQDADKVKKQTELEKRLREINVEIIRYKYESHIGIEPFFGAIHNKQLTVHNYVEP
jgi:NAD-dependent SIR2 family protein deacetylase